MAAGSTLVPPSSVCCMKDLDREKFELNILVPTVVVDEHKVGKLLSCKAFKRLILTIRGIKPVRPLADAKKAILLDSRQFTDGDDIEKLISELQDLKEIDYSIDSLAVSLTYDNWTADEIIRSVLPGDVPHVTGFTVVGHVAHLNLKEQHADYRYLIGQVILDKHKNIRTVVNKTDAIDNTYRNFQMEVLAGEDDLLVCVKENGCAYRFDFSKVYWNSRLGTEHSRVVDDISSSAVVYDVCAGVGPFSIPAAKKGATVYANDLNPDSYNALCENLSKNKCQGTFYTYNMDAVVFINEVMGKHLAGHIQQGGEVTVIMNLPALAIQFIGAFVGLLAEEPLDASSIKSTPTVHCYCFSKDAPYEEDAAARANSILRIDGHVTADMCRRVRNVAPNKEMICISFPLTVDLLMKSSVEGTQIKRPRLDQ